MKNNIIEIKEKFQNMKPGKYWTLPANKKHLIDEYLLNEDYLPMVKIDGYWARAIILEDEVLIQSRGISKVTGTYGDYTPLVPHIAAELVKTWPAGTVLIGELAFDDISRTAQEVGSILRCKAPKAIERQKEEENKIHYFVFDVLAYDGEEIYHKNFEDRFISYPEFSKTKYVKPVPSYSNQEAPKVLENIWAQGGEGMILINKKLPYKIGNAQAWHSIKVKKELGELEGQVVDIIKPNREYQGTELNNWPYWVDENDNRIDKTQISNMMLIPGLTPVTKPYYYNTAVGVIVEYQGRLINITSGTTEEDGEFLVTQEAQDKIKNGELYAVFSGMELTETSVRHPVLIRLRDDIK